MIKIFAIGFLVCVMIVYSCGLSFEKDDQSQNDAMETVRSDWGDFGGNPKRKVVIYYAIPTNGNEVNAYLVCFAKVPKTGKTCRLGTFGHRESVRAGCMKIDLGVIGHPVGCMQLFYDYYDPDILELGSRTLNLQKGRIIFCDKNAQFHQLQEKIPVAELKEIDKLEAYFIGLEQRLYAQFRDSFPPETTHQGE